MLWEMRPVRMTPAHQTDRFAELVCSNSLKSDQHPSASWLLKEELRRLGCFLIAAAYDTRVPGGQALTVDRESFAEQVTRAIDSNPSSKCAAKNSCNSIRKRSPSLPPAR